MIRRCLYIAFVVVVPLAVVLLAGWSVVTKDRWAKRRLVELLTVQAAQTLNAEVRVGRIDGNVLTGLKITDLAISEEQSLAESTLLSVDQIALKYDLWPVLRRDLPPIESVEEVRITGLEAKLSRDQRGRLNIQRFLDLRKPSKKPPKARFKGRIVVEDAEIRYTDAASSPSFLRDLDLLIGNINATADFAEPQAVRYELTAEGFEAPFDRLEATGSAMLANNAVSVHGMVLGAEVPALYRRFAANPALQVDSGVANAEIDACVVPGELLDYALVGHVDRLGARLAPLRGERVVASGDFTVTPAGVDLPHVTLAALGSQIVGSGVVVDLSNPAIDIEATADNVDLDRWAAVVPEVKEALPEITGAKGGRIGARIAGPLLSPDVRAAAEFPHEVRVAYPLPQEPGGELAAGQEAVLRAAGRGLSVAVAIPDVETRDVKARVKVGELEVGDLGELLPDQDYLTQLTADPLRDVSAELVYSRDTPAIAGRLGIDRVETEHGPIKGVDIDAALIGRTIVADASVDNVLGAKVESARALVDLSEEPVGVYARFDASAIDAAKVASIAKRDDMGLAGTLSASGVAAIRGQKVQAAAQVTGSRIAIQGIEIHEAAANVGLTREAADVRFLSATSPFGQVWARGQVRFDGPIEAEIAVADVPLDQVQAVVQERQQESKEKQAEGAADRPEPVRVAGTVFLNGKVRGELKRPEIDANVAAFDVGAEKWTAPMVTARVTGTPQDVWVTNARVRRGTAVASGQVRLSDITWPPGSFFSEEPPSDDPEARPPPLDGALEGTVALTGLDLSQLGEFVSLPEDLLVTGLVDVPEVTIGGSLQSPRAEGEVLLQHGKAALVDRDIAVGPVALGAHVAATRNALTVSGASARVNSGQVEPSGEVGRWTVGLAGELSGWNAEEGPQIVAELTATDLPIGTYTPVEGVASHVDGVIDSVHAAAAGPLSDPWPDADVDIAADQVRFGNRSVQDLSAHVSHRAGQLGAERVRCKVAGGQIEVPVASYRLSDGKLFANAELTDISVPEALAWVGDIASQEHDQAEAAATRQRFYGLASRLRGRVSADKLTVGNTLSDLWGQVEGLRTHGAELDHKPIPDVEATCTFQGLCAVRDASAASDPDALPASPLARLHIDDIAVSGDLPAGFLTAAGHIHWDGKVAVTAEADLVPVEVLEPWLPRGLNVEGQVHLTAWALGEASDPTIHGSVEVLDPKVAGLDFDVLEATSIDVTRDAIVIDDGSLKRGPHEIKLVPPPDRPDLPACRLPFDRDELRFDGAGDVSFHAVLDNWPLQALVDVAGDVAERNAPPQESVWRQCEADGFLTASLDVSGALDEPEVSGRLSVERGATFRLRSWPDGTAIKDIWVDAELDPSPTGVGSTIKTLNCSALIDQTKLAIDEGRLEVSHLSPDEFLANRVDKITLTAEAAEQRLPGGTVATNIDALFEAHTDAAGWHIVEVKRASADLGKGKARLTGAALIDTLRLDELGQIPCNLRLEMEDAGISYGSVVRHARVNGVIAARKFASRTGRALPNWFLENLPADAPTDPAGPIRIVSLPVDRDTGTGSLTVTRAAIGLPARKKAPAEPADEELPLEPGQQFVIYGLPRSFPAPEMDVSVAIGPGVTVDTPIVEADVTPRPKAITIVGTPQAPRIEAAAALRRGRLRLPRGNLEVSDAEADVTIQPPPWSVDTRSPRRKLEIAGHVSAHAEGTVTAVLQEDGPATPVRVKLELVGTLPPGQLQDLINVSSSPPLAAPKIYELLALSPVSPTDQAAAGPATPAQKMLTELVARNLLEDVLQPLRQELSEALGLEEFELLVGFDKAVDLRVGKYIIENLLISYHRSEGGPEEEFNVRLSYNIRDRYQVTYQTDEDARQQVNVEYRWQF